MIAPDAVLAGLATPTPVPEVVCFSALNDTGIHTYAVRTGTHQRCCAGCGATDAVIRPVILLTATVELCEACAWTWIAHEQRTRQEAS